MNPFELTIKKLHELGFFQFFLPFILTATIFYGLLRKSKIFGEPKENVVVNGMVALIAAFMVWASPIILGVNIEMQLAAFFLHGMLATLVMIVGLIIVSLFAPPDLPKHLTDVFKTSRFWAVVLVAGILIAGSLIFTSGLLNIFIPSAAGIQEISWDWIMSLGIVIAMIVTAFLIAR